jgi:hypothetical protein
MALLRPALALTLMAGLAVPALVRASPLPVVDPTVAEQRDTEAVVMHGSDFPTWAVPGNVTAKLPFTDLMCVEQVSNDCDHNHYAAPDADTGAAAGVGPDVNKITGWRWQGGRFVEVPFQVDQVFTRYLDNSASSFAIYSGEDQHTTYQFDREGFRWTKGTCVATPEDPAHPVATDPVKGLDTDDELAFMAADTGAQAPSTAKRPHGTTAVQEVAVVDPLTQQTTYLYVMLGRTPAFTAANGYVHYQRDADADRFAFSQSSYSDYGNAAVGPYCDAQGNVIGTGRRRPIDTATITTDRYRFRYDGRWLMTDIRVKKDSDTTYGPDLVDRWKARAFQQDRESNTPCCGYEEEDTHWGGSSTLLGERSGPVRTIRETWGADSGTNVVRRETYYRGEMTQKTWLRVHVIPPLDGIYAQWDYNAGIMTRFRNPQQPDGVAVDGKNDETFGNLDDPCSPKYDNNDTGMLTQTYRNAYATAGVCAISPYHQSMDLADPTFGNPSVALQWGETSGPFGTIVDRMSTEARDVTPGGAAQSVSAQPYYRDDSCFDDATGSDPGVRRNLGGSNEPKTASNGTPRRCWTPQDGVPAAGNDQFFQGDIGAHGVHLLFQVDSDNARQTVPIDEIVTSQRQVFLPGDPGNVGEKYGRAFEKPLVAHATPVTYDEAPLATSLTWTGDTSTGDANRVRLAARLVDEDGHPVVGANVALTLDGKGVTVATGPDGTAETTVKVTGKPQPHTGRADYAGDAAHAPCSVTRQVTDSR